MSTFTNAASSTPDEIAAYVAALLDLLGGSDPCTVLGQTTVAIQRFLDTVTSDVAGRPEAPGKWSIREVIQHLADSELVGGFRLRMVLAHDRPRLTGYDQDLWAERLHYRDADIRAAFDQFAALRRANLPLWQGLSQTDLSRVGLHGERGEESLAHMRRLYAGHDLLHLRQLERIRTATCTP